jgi:Transcriptional regulator
MDQALLVFVTVAEQKNFTRAAERLHMTQPAVSQYIVALERAVGSKLLERSNKRVQLNKAGEIVYHHAKEILGLYVRMQCLVDDLLHKAGGSLSIGASYTFGEYVLPHVIAGLREHYPHITPTISISNTKEVAEMVVRNRLDVGIIEGEFKDEKLLIEPFLADQMYVVSSPRHPLSQNGCPSPASLNDATWIIREEGSGTREATENLFKMLRISPAHLMEFGSSQIIKESVEADLGITLLSRWAIRKEISLGSLVRLNITGTPFSRQFSLVMPATPFRTRATEVFLDILRSNNFSPPPLRSRHEAIFGREQEQP